MKLKLFVCLVAAGGLAVATSAVAAPEFVPFLSVDVNGYQNNDGVTLPGNTQAGYQAWDVDAGIFGTWAATTNSTGVSQVFATGQGPVTATLIGHTGRAETTPPQAGTRSARDRGDVLGEPMIDLTRDFVFAGRSRDGFGQNWLELKLSGLVPGQNYEFTGWARDRFNGAGDPTLYNSSWQSWTDQRRLDGAAGPGPWMDVRFGAGSVYQPAIGGAHEIPAGARSPITGGATTLGDEFRYAASFRTRANALGVVTVYTFADPNGYSGTQTATLLNGFNVGVAPEPTSMAMFALGLIGFGLRRRVR